MRKSPMFADGKLKIKLRYERAKKSDFLHIDCKDYI